MDGPRDDTDTRSRTTLMIAARVAFELGLPLSALMQKRLTKQAALARHVTMYLARAATRRSYFEIAHDLGMQHHSSVMYGEQRVRGLLGKDEYVRALVETVAEKLSPLRLVAEPADRDGFGRVA